MRAYLRLQVVLAIAIFFTCADFLFSQVGSNLSQLNGTVVDQSDRSIPKAALTLRETETNRTHSTVSNENGFYVFASVQPGRYELVVEAAGFARTVQTGIVLTVGQVATVNVSLKLASIGEKVVVTTEVPVIEPTKTEISQVIATQQIGSLPTSGRLFTDFALLTPGVATSRTSLGTTFTEYEATQISFGGMRSFSNEVTLDGADFINSTSGVQRTTPPQESVQEFRVVNNSFGAEYGRALGGIVNIVSKSGTNDLHGSVYDYLQNSSADARSLLQPAPLPHTLRQNQFGGTLGGPIHKDKTFFFANYEGKRRAETPAYAPDLVNNITTIDAAKAYLGLAPEGCTLALAACTGTPIGYLDSFLKVVDNDYGFVRMDHQINDNNRLGVRYVVEDARDFGELVSQTLDGGGIGTPSGGRNLFIRDQSLVGTLDSSLKPNLINSALVQYARRHYNFPGATGQPDLSVVNDLEFGHNFGTYDAIYESRVEGADSVSWVKGNHVAKFGFDGNYVWAMTNFPGFTPERILIPNLDCLVDFANFVSGPGSAANKPAISQIHGPAGCPLDPPFPGANPGADGVAFLYMGIALPRTGFTNGVVPPAATGAGFGSAWPNAFPTNLYQNYAYDLNHGYWGFFAQDQWRVTHRLTLNYGLRWDFESGLGNQIDADYRAFQPRVGIAFSPNNKTVVRAGFGIFFDRNNMTFFFTPGGQKTIPGYMCYPASAASPGCAGATPVQMPMVRSGADGAGWQLGGLPGFPATPPNAAAGLAAAILAGSSYPPAVLSGVCNPAAGFFACGVGAGGMDHHASRLPYAEQASLEIDRQIAGGLSVDLGYQFVAAHKLVRGNNINVPCPVGTSKPGNPADVQGWLNPNATLTPCQGTPTLAPLGLGPIFNSLANPTGLEFGGAPFNPTGLSAGLLDYNNDVANAVYHGLTVTAIEKAGKLFNLTANYTYSHTIDNGNFTTFINLPPNQFDYGMERANSNQDARHRVVANFTVRTPDSNFLRHLEFSSIITVQSGRPFTLFAGENTLGDLAGSSTDRTGGLPGKTTCTSVSDCNTLIARNTYTGDPLRTWDARISRYFQLREKVRLDVSVDAFNLFNRANVDEVTSIYGPVFCGAIPGHYKDAATLAIQSGSVSCASQIAATVGPAPGLNFPGGAFLAQGLIPVPIPPTPNQTFGLPRTMLNPRQLQLSLKLSF
jgi:outer membrane receptor protein involved in Fe transport